MSIKTPHKFNYFSFIEKQYIFVLFLITLLFSSSVVAQTTIYSENFDASAGGWTVTSTGAGTGQWLQGTDTAYNTGALGSYFYSRRYAVEYNNDTFITATSPAINLSNYTNITLDIDIWYFTETGYDGLKIEYSLNNGTSWADLGTIANTNWYNNSGVDAFNSFEDGWSGNSGGWTSRTINLSTENIGFESATQAKIRVLFATDFSITYTGVAFDNVIINGVPVTPPIAPGGVAADLSLWLKSTDGLAYADGQSVSLWTDQGNGADATVPVVGLEPTYRDNPNFNINFNPVVDFDNDYNTAGTDYGYSDTNRNTLAGTSGFYTQDIFMVVIPDVTVTSTLASMDVFCGDSDPLILEKDGLGIGFGRYSVRFSDEVLSFAIGTSSDVSTPVDSRGYGIAHTSTTDTYSNVGIVNTRNNTALNGNTLYYNAVNVGNTEVGVPNFTNVNDSKYWIGRSEGFEGSFDGRICEIITYSSRKTDANLTQERNKIQSYLAIKYGITLGVNGTSQDYVDSTGSLIWDSNTGVAADDVFNFDITGIGRDDSSTLNQKQSKSVNSKPVPVAADDITIGLVDIATTNNLNTNTFDTDKSFLVWGNNDGDLSAATPTTTDMSANIAGLNTVVEFEEFNRKWKIVESGSVGKVKISLPIAMVPSTLSTTGDYLMFISSTPTFTPFSEYRILKLNGTNLETTYDFTGTKYIIFGFAPEKEFVRSVKFTGGTVLGGTNDFLNADDVIDLPNSFSISAWVKRDVGVNNVEIISKRDIPYTTGYGIYINNFNKIRMDWKDATNTTQTIISNVALPENEWHHIAIIYDGANAKMYIDGVLSNTVALSLPVATTEHFLVGAANYKAPTRFFKGNIDEVRVWNAVLTENQLRYIMNQEIQKNGLNVAASYFNRGLVTSGSPAGVILAPSAAVTLTKDEISGIPWSNLQVYYPMSKYTYTNARDESNNGYTAAIQGIQTVDYQTAPLPYISNIDGDWDVNTTWLSGSIQTIPGTTSIVDNTKTIDWNIVEINNNITMSNASLPSSALGDNNRSLLGLIVKGNKLTIDGNNATVTGNGITVTHYLKLDGVLDLEGESQLIQTNQSDLEVNSSGYIEKDQQGTANAFTYNYWSAPVSLINTATNNTPYKIIDVVKDGTNPSTPVTPSFEAATTQNAVDANYADGALTSPIRIAKYWMWKFVNTGNDYANWSWAGNANLNVTEGYTLKGVSGASAITDTQNYTFIGKPNNVLNGQTQIIHTTFAAPSPDPYISLTGNPFPSALDADKFITDNIVGTGTGAIDGSLYFWEHWGGGSHILSEYQGGYAIRNLTTGVAAVSHPDIDQTGTGTKIPGQFVPPGQGFFIKSSATGGNVVFNNIQRKFIKKGASSIFIRQAASSTNNTTTNETDKMIIRLGFKSPEGFHRQVAVGFNIVGATDGIDIGYDAKSGDKLSNDAFLLINDENYVIQAFANFDEYREIPIVINIDSNNNQGLETIMLDGLENVPDDVNIYIKDTFTGQTYDIKTQPYEVTLATGEYKTRFYLVFIPLTQDTLSTNEELDQQLKVYVNNTQSLITITKDNNIEVKEITMYNYLGQKVQEWSKNLSENTLKLPLNKTSTGAYILKIKLNKNTISKKIIIK